MSTPDATPRGRILIVEDDADVLEVLKLMLEGEGHTVVPVKEGRQALAEARAKPFDMIVMDISMPGMSGIEVGQALRADARTADIRIVLHTAVEKRWVEERFADHDLFVAKADDTDRLVEDIGKLLAAPRVPHGSEPVEPMYSPEEVLRAQCALRSAIGLGAETFPERAFIGMLGGEIEQLRKIGKSAPEIEELISTAIGRPLSPTAVAQQS
ncbi:MAG TPA: response regulator [Caldimonas sp.]|jgi:CheY-like chemotaxis protein|nr:response regulator [Caldimonas sp.]HEX2539896.1 response regulator [Caldimonas sp.]